MRGNAQDKDNEYSASRCLARKAGIPQISVYCLTPGAIDLDTCMRTIERRC